MALQDYTVAPVPHRLGAAFIAQHHRVAGVRVVPLAHGQDETAPGFGAQWVRT